MKETKPKRPNRNKRQKAIRRLKRRAASARTPLRRFMADLARGAGDDAETARRWCENKGVHVG